MRRGLFLVLLFMAGVASAGCDSEDPERLNRVGKKLVEKSRRLAEEADLPTITITRAEKKEKASKEPGNEERKTENRE